MLVRLAAQKDETGIRHLFTNDVYHWCSWVWPVFRHGILFALPTPIVTALLLPCLILPWDQNIALFVGGFFFVALALVFLAKLYMFLKYFWCLPELEWNNLSELYFQKGHAFFVALRGKLLAVSRC